MYTIEQLSIINHTQGHARVNAVAGSGKTQTMVARITKLMADGVPAKRIAVVMFNSQAAQDFYQRLTLEIQNSPEIEYQKDRFPVVRTLHSLAARMIHTLMQNEALPVYTFDPDKAFLHGQFCAQALTELNQNDDIEAIENLQGVIAWMKSRCDDTLNYQSKEDCLEVRLFKAYEKIRHQHKVRFFDDLLYDTALAVKNNPALVMLLGNKVKHLIIDEFQDINPCQMILIKIIAGTKANVMIVGDVNQSIYGFRGAEPNIMLHDFPNTFNATTDFCLSKTFRFGQQLSDIANQCIQANTSRYDLNCISHESTQETQVHFVAESDYDPITLVNQHQQAGDYSQIAVLVREFTHKVRTEMALLRADIPYQVLGGDSLLNHKAVISLLGYLRLADEAENLLTLSESLRKYTVRCMLDVPSLSMHYGLKKQLINRLSEVPDNENIFMNIAHQLQQAKGLKDDDLKKQQKNLSRREDIWGNALFYDANASAYLILKDLYKNQLKYPGFFDFTSQKLQEAIYKKALLQGLIDWAKDLQDRAIANNIKSFLAHVDHCREQYTELVKQGRGKCLTITSMHSSKGLQWDTVILPELLRGNLPVTNDKGVAEDEEGDRRLFYVAMTRARKQVYFIGGDDLNHIQAHARDEAIDQDVSHPSSLFLYQSYPRQVTSESIVCNEENS